MHHHIHIIFMPSCIIFLCFTFAQIPFLQYLQSDNEDYEENYRMDHAMSMQSLNLETSLGEVGGIIIDHTFLFIIFNLLHL